jgi:hypothetical protein
MCNFITVQSVFPDQGEIDENSAPPTLGGGEGKPARSYVFLRSVQYNNGEPFSVVNLHLDRRIYDRGASAPPARRPRPKSSR